MTRPPCLGSTNIIMYIYHTHLIWKTSVLVENKLAFVEVVIHPDRQRRSLDLWQYLVNNTMALTAI